MTKPSTKKPYSLTDLNHFDRVLAKQIVRDCFKQANLNNLGDFNTPDKDYGNEVLFPVLAKNLQDVKSEIVDAEV